MLHILVSICAYWYVRVCVVCIVCMSRYGYVWLCIGMLYVCASVHVEPAWTVWKVRKVRNTRNVWNARNMFPDPGTTSPYNTGLGTKSVRHVYNNMYNFAQGMYRLCAELGQHWYQVGTKCEPTWYTVGTILVQRWYQHGTIFVCSWYQLGTKIGMVLTVSVISLFD